MCRLNEYINVFANAGTITPSYNFGRRNDSNKEKKTNNDILASYNKHPIVSSEIRKRGIQANMQVHNIGDGMDDDDVYAGNDIAVDISILMTEEYQDVKALQISTSKFMSCVIVSILLSPNNFFSTNIKFTLSLTLPGEEKAIVLDLLQVATRLICLNTNFKIIATNNPTRNVCESFSQRKLVDNSNKIETNREGQRNLNDSTSTLLSVNPNDAIVSVYDVPLFGYSYLRFTMRYALEKVGNDIKVLSDLTLGLDSPLEIVQTKVQDVITSSIHSGLFLVIIQEYDERVDSVANFGTEEVIFGDIIVQFDSYKSQNDLPADDDADVLYSSGNPPVTPIHPIRVIGVLMFFFFVMLTICMYCLGKKRFHERMLFEKNLQMNAKTIGLSSEEAVTAMLDVGRRKAVNGNKKNEAEDGRSAVVSPETIANRKWEVMIGKENVLIS